LILDFKIKKVTELRLPIFRLFAAGEVFFVPVKKLLLVERLLLEK
jgi:hypothetical protein